MDHRGLGPVGNHLDGVDEVLAGGVQLREALVRREVLDGDAPGGGFALTFPSVLLAQLPQLAARSNEFRPWPEAKVRESFAVGVQTRV